MRIALITGVLLLALGTGALAETRVSYQRHGTNCSYDFGLSLGDPFYDPFALGSDANDRGGFRAFIPRGLTGQQIYYSSDGYRGGRPSRGSYGGGSGSYYYRQGDYSGGTYRHRYYRPQGAYTILQGQPYWDGYSWSYGYGAPTYIFPGRSPVIIDPNGSDYSAPQQGDVYNDNRVYDNDTYDNSQTVNNYNYAPPAPVQRAAPPRPNVGPVAPKSEPIAPQAPAVRVSPVGVRFIDQGRIGTPDGARIYRIENGVLYTQLDGAKQVKVADKVDENFGGYAVVESAGSSVIFRQGDKLAAAVPTDKGWDIDPLPYRVDFSRKVSFSLVAGEPWITFTAPDDTRWVVKLSGHQWVEVGSGSR